MFHVRWQVLDDGQLTDNKGRTVNFKNTVIIMTSNLGANIIQQNFEGVNEKNMQGVVETTKLAVMEVLKQQIRPEFLNRIDENIMFKPLMLADITEIVKLQIGHLVEMLNERGVKLEVTENALKSLAGAGYDPQFGARPLKRVLQKEVVNNLSKKILSDEIQPNSKILLDSIDGHLMFQNMPEVEPSLN